MTPVISAGDTAWVLMSTALVMLMVAGLAFFYGGLVRSKSSLNTMMMSAAALGLVGVQWVLFGYTLAFHAGSGLLGGLGWLGLVGVGGAPAQAYSGTIPAVVFAGFQLMFAAITVALVSGAVVERMRFPAYLLFALLWTTIVYDPLAHWVWGQGGWLRNLGALDFAGGTVVHVSAGVSALVAALFLGSRRDQGREPMVPHNVPFVLLGAGLLWFGWFGFNGGSALAASGLAGTAVMTTNTAAAAALVTWMLLDHLRSGRSTAVGAATGAVVGLVAITPAAGFVTPLSAIAIGVLAAGASYTAMQLRSRTRVDDALDVFACHGVGGIVGALLTGVFASKAVNPAGANGLLYGNPAQLGIQAAAVGATIVLALVATSAILVTVRALVGLRLPIEEEITGIDLAEHGEEAYYGGGVGVLAGPRSSIGESIFLPVPDGRRLATEKKRAVAG